MNRKFKNFLPAHALTLAIAILAACLVAPEWAKIRSNPIAYFATIRTSLVYILLSWTIVAVILLGAYFLSSLEETRSLLRASLFASVPAMWFVPAILLVGM